MAQITYNDKSNYQSSSLANEYKVTSNDINEIKNVINANTPIGTIQMYAGNTAPTGWLICDGSAISRTTYANLFSVIGTTYGSGNGTTTFNLPNLKGRIPVGYDSSDTNFDSLGETGGSKTHQHNTALFSQSSTGAGGNVAVNWNSSQYGLSTGETIQSGAWGEVTAAGVAGNKTGYAYKTSASSSLQPYIVLNYIISY